MIGSILIGCNASGSKDIMGSYISDFNLRIRDKKLERYEFHENGVVTSGGDLDNTIMWRYNKKTKLYELYSPQLNNATAVYIKKLQDGNFEQQYMTKKVTLKKYAPLVIGDADIIGSWNVIGAETYLHSPFILAAEGKVEKYKKYTAEELENVRWEYNPVDYSIDIIVEGKPYEGKTIYFANFKASEIEDMKKDGIKYLYEDGDDFAKADAVYQKLS